MVCFDDGVTQSCDKENNNGPLLYRHTQTRLDSTTARAHPMMSSRGGLLECRVHTRTLLPVPPEVKSIHRTTSTIYKATTVELAREDKM